MYVSDRNAGEILVERDTSSPAVELRIEGAAGGARIIRLSVDEARRLAALILFQAARLDRRRPAPVVPIGAAVRLTA
jgi:hypothetical protein